MKRTDGKKPFQESIRNDLSFSNDILKITSDDQAALTVTWELTDALLSAAEAVLLEDKRDIKKQIRLTCIKDGQKMVQTIHIESFKGEVTVSQAAGGAYYKAEYRLYNALNISLSILSSDRFYLEKNGIAAGRLFYPEDKRHDWVDQFSAYTGYSLNEGKGSVT
ncbi:hypothetical protein [Bacillus sp. HSf4]|uniref:hypothetical protein n=1 Tax=Bacillus sp. HSf4 TaxID=3035514 RepID=UPI0024090553|nr:hypothetical protein [Bacillus sp. HSf4]WFA03725.1 hypothetical protein P3X63_13725 [Bacillus sp. HSf4]